MTWAGRTGASLALAVLAVAGTIGAGCESQPRSAAAPAAAARPVSVPVARAAPLEYLERCPSAGCAGRLPLLVAIHGLGDTPEDFGAVYEGLRTPARVLLLRAPLPWGRGRAWFPYRSAETPPETIAPALLELVPRVLATIDQACSVHPCDGRVVVSGFSQGGMLSYALAARAPERFAAAIPISGFLVPGVDPVRAPELPTIVAFHGDADGVVSSRWDQDGAARLSRAGFDVDLRLVRGVGHHIPESERMDILAVIEGVLSPQ